MTKPVRPNAVVWYRLGSDVMHHRRISDWVSLLVVKQRVRPSPTLRLQLRQLGVDVLEMRLAEVDFWETLLA